jgi:hypothetical protein
MKVELIREHTIVIEDNDGRDIAIGAYQIKELIFLLLDKLKEYEQKKR